MLNVFASFLFLVFAVAIYSNQRRKARVFHYELTPNCLLTRWPVLFVTGKRSLFYFTNYWNVYPEFLTEHGYEVYTLRLPWSSPSERLAKMQEFLQEHAAKGRRYHLMVDAPTRREFEILWAKKFSCVESLSEINEGLSARSSVGFIHHVSYFFHRLKCGRKNTPDMNVLGVSRRASLQNGQLLLHRASQLAEDDFQRDDEPALRP